MAEVTSPDKNTQSQSSSSGSSGQSSSQSQQSTGQSSLESGGTVQTLDVVDGEFLSEEEEEDKIWGKLYPVGGKCFNIQELEKDEYIFGRDAKSDVCFDPKTFKKHPHYQAFSKMHFTIFREVKADKTVGVFVKDCSSNGTFVNGQKIGKGNIHPLHNGDEIALSTKKNKAYVFYDCDQSAQEQENLPPDMKEKYIISREIGRGACGEVKLVFEKGTCHRFAVKMINKKKFSVGPSARSAIQDEVNILKALKHPGIIAIQEVYETQDMLYIILELVEGGELFDRVVSVGRFDEPSAKLIFYQLLTAVDYLHTSGITHRDLKPENVLLVSDVSNTTLIKITDFGLSRFVGEQSLMKTLCGTPSYLAPEIITSAGMGGYTKMVDLWSLGVILYILLGGYPPFSDQLKTHPIDVQITEGMYSFPDQYWGPVSSEAKDLIRKLLTVNPEDRIPVSGALLHPWMQDEEVIKKALKLMYEDEMPPPSAPVSRKRSAEEEPMDCSNKKSKS